MTLLGLLNQTITISSPAAYGGDGRATFSSGTEVRARFEPETKRILLPNGSLFTIDGVMIVGPNTTVASDYRVAYNGIYYRVVDVFDVPGGDGVTHHKELRVVKWPA